MQSKVDLFLVGEISSAMFFDFTIALAKLEHEKGKKRIVEIQLLSEGGDANVAVAFFDRIRNSPLTINITGIGFVASAAVLVLASGDTRRLTKNSTVMVHEEGLTDISGSVSQVEKEAARFRRSEDAWNSMMEQVTGTPAETWKYLHVDETYLNAQQCLELNLIQEIV